MSALDTYVSMFRTHQNDIYQCTKLEPRYIQKRKRMITRITEQDRLQFLVTCEKYTAGYEEMSSADVNQKT
jgi:hypothetical protein